MTDIERQRALAEGDIMKAGMLRPIVFDVTTLPLPIVTTLEWEFWGRASFLTLRGISPVPPPRVPSWIAEPEPDDPTIVKRDEP
jgi:hypothetical protein